MQWTLRLVRSSIGGKVVMAVTGVLLFGFVLAHLAGNLLVFGGPEALNAYGQGLRDLGPLLWVMRFGLLGVLALHLVMAARLVRENRAARPIPYACDATIQASRASRSMLLTGMSVAAYALFHLAHFTWGILQPSTSHGVYVLRDGREVHDVYTMVVAGFHNIVLVLLYTAAMGALGLHLAHGVSSLLQTLGIHQRRFQGSFRRLGPVLAVVIVVAYLSIPFSALIGILSLEGSPS